MSILGNTSIQRSSLLILMFFVFASASESEMEKFSFAHEVKVLVSDTEIVAGKVIKLKIRATGDKVRFSEIDEIDGVKVLERQERVTNMFHYVNGVLKKERTTLILTFAPHHDMTIPSYEIEIDGKIYHSQSVKIKVHSDTAQNRENNNKFFLYLETDKKSVVLGESVLAKVYFSLKNGVRLVSSPEYTPPLFKGFFSQEIAKEKVYAKGNRQVTELTYLLTPLEEGEFNMGPARAKMAVASKHRRDMFGRFVASTVPIASNRVNIKVKKKKQESDLVGEFILESSLDKQKVKANKPVNLTVKIAGNGVLDDLIFPAYEMAGVTVYSDDAEVSSELKEGNISSHYVKRFVFISDHDFTITARRISVYDLKTQKLKYLEIPAYDVKVEGATSVAVTGPTLKNPMSGRVQTNLTIPDKKKSSEKALTVLADVADAETLEMLLLLLAFLSGAMVMWLMHYLPQLHMKRYLGSHSETEALKILYPYMSESAEAEAMVRQLYEKKKSDKDLVIDKTKLKKLLEKYEHKN